VKEGGYDAALAFDGDADRLLMLDETGALVDGDRILAILGADMQQRGELSHNTIVATVMSNLGLHRFVKEKQLCLLCTKVGDRYVLEEMLRGGYDLGGEQSGHVILREYATTGDGQLTAVRLLSVLARSGKKLSELAGRMRQYPQVLVNLEVPTDCKMACMQAVEVQNLLQLWEERLAGDGRILLRPSGTEPLLRVMVEGADDGIIRQCAEEIAEAARRVRDQIRDKGI